MKKLLIISPLLFALGGCFDEPASEEQVKEFLDAVLDKTEVCFKEVAIKTGANDNDIRKGLSMMKTMIDAQVPELHKHLTDKEVSASDFKACIDATKVTLSEISCNAMMNTSTPPEKECEFLADMANPFK